jgi:dinuclear metal center YbgI/SA1388 family protein
MARPTSSRYRVADLVAAMDAIAPPHFAENWDNVGLIAGRPDAPLRRALLTIDLTRAVHDEVLAAKAQALVAYHPPIFKPTKTLRIIGDEAPSLALSLLSRGIAIYTPHTALDVAAGGTNDALADCLGLKVTGSLSHAPGRGQHLKLVTFVPEADVEKVADAVFAAGAGHLGDQSKYTQCSFRTPGTGTFKGDPDTNPAVGRPGTYERAPEVRFETILPVARASDVIRALLAAHPYEVPAFDLLQLHTPPEPVGLGRYAQLPRPVALSALADLCKQRLGVSQAQIIGNPRMRCTTAALVAGSAGRIALDNLQRRYDVLITGELPHHDMLAYQAAGLAVICLGHSQTERPVLPVLAAALRQHLPRLDIRISQRDAAPFHIR